MAVVAAPGLLSASSRNSVPERASFSRPLRLLPFVQIHLAELSPSLSSAAWVARHRSGRPDARLSSYRQSFFQSRRRAELPPHWVTEFVGLTRAPAFGGACCLGGFGQHAESAVYRRAIGKHVGEVGLNQHQVRPGRRPAIVFAANAARQLRKIIFLSHLITAFRCRFLPHTAFARSVFEGAHQ